MEENFNIGGNILERGEIVTIKDEGVTKWDEASRRRKRLEQDQQIIEIVRHLVKNQNYIAHGFWFCRRWQCTHVQRCRNREICDIKALCQHISQCRKGIICQEKFKSECQKEQKCEHKPQCRDSTECWKKKNNQNRKRWQCENQCQHRWRIQYSQESLEEYLRETPKRPTDFFTQNCNFQKKALIGNEDHKKALIGNEDHEKALIGNEDHEKVLISSFLLYKPENSDEPTTEIICHLEWKSNYRVFGNWKCLRCENRWRSAYTWISLQKFIEQEKHLGDGEFIKQKCKKCNNDDNCIISYYKPLELSKDGTYHKRQLCAKCQHGEICVETGDYYGYQKA